MQHKSSIKIYTQNLELFQIQVPKVPMNYIHCQVIFTLNYLVLLYDLHPILPVVKHAQYNNTGPAGRNAIIGEDGSPGSVGKLGSPGQTCKHASSSTTSK